MGITHSSRHGESLRELCLPSELVCGLSFIKAFYLKLSQGSFPRFPPSLKPICPVIICPIIPNFICLLCSFLLFVSFSP